MEPLLVQKEEPSTSIRAKGTEKQLPVPRVPEKEYKPNAANSCESIYRWWKANGVNPDRSGTTPKPR